MNQKPVAIFEEDLRKIRDFAKKNGNTASNVASVVMQRALEIIELDDLEYPVAKKRGRKPGTTIKREQTVEPSVDDFDAVDFDSCSDCLHA